MGIRGQRNYNEPDRAIQRITPLYLLNKWWGGQIKYNEPDRAIHHNSLEFAEQAAIDGEGLSFWDSLGRKLLI